MSLLIALSAPCTALATSEGDPSVSLRIPWDGQTDVPLNTIPRGIYRWNEPIDMYFESSEEVIRLKENALHGWTQFVPEKAFEANTTYTFHAMYEGNDYGMSSFTTGDAAIPVLEPQPPSLSIDGFCPTVFPETEDDCFEIEVDWSASLGDQDPYKVGQVRVRVEGGDYGEDYGLVTPIAHYGDPIRDPNWTYAYVQAGQELCIEGVYEDLVENRSLPSKNCTMLPGLEEIRGMLNCDGQPLSEAEPYYESCSLDDEEEEDFWAGCSVAENSRLPAGLLFPFLALFFGRFRSRRR